MSTHSPLPSPTAKAILLAMNQVVSRLYVQEDDTTGRCGEGAFEKGLRHRSSRVGCWLSRKESSFDRCQTRSEGQDCPGWLLRHRVRIALATAKLPLTGLPLEGYIIGSG